MMAEEYNLKNDITLCCLTAKSFPDGVMDAHQALHAMFPNPKERRFFGISRPNGKGTIIYNAAVVPLNDAEVKKLGLETLVIKKGSYTSIIIPDFMKDVQQIGKAF